MTIKPYGNQAILVEFAAQINPNVNRQVMALNAYLNNASLEGVKASIPAYNSLTILYDPKFLSFEVLRKHILEWTPTHSLSSTSTNTKKIVLPVCYEPPFALDMDWVLRHTGLSKQTLIDFHSQAPFQVYMLGFLPGFAYLGKVPLALACPRKPTPRLKIPKGAVGLAGQQTGIYPSSSPGGWQIIGQTPIPVFNPDQKQPFLLHPGDLVQFKAISSRTFEQIEQAILTQQFNWKSIYE
ncbi:5-oxoprolinase subunit PxpB [Aureispira anguillae]|uniref:5-oxoprolinase subunit PxpB n=1 Tax=Aureispira anguillae TaxID=2864201 RepID=A0A915VJX1_9BACT|nr:5-oxoprolinase subunit PxpB [Aureispira anguillae]BDS09396.1 5-oxoprolinase subunit PxpB [Aureispira anguillae]